ncbi:MAG: hypothetical protein R2749_18025 [Acidimicrobiales bacterium]
MPTDDAPSCCTTVPAVSATARAWDTTPVASAAWWAISLMAICSCCSESDASPSAPRMDDAELATAPASLAVWVASSLTAAVPEPTWRTAAAIWPPRARMARAAAGSR